MPPLVNDVSPVPPLATGTVPNEIVFPTIVIGEVAALANHLHWYGDATTKRLDTSPIADLAAET